MAQQKKPTQEGTIKATVKTNGEEHIGFEPVKQIEEETMQLQKQRFGVKGDYFQKRQELIKPLQDRVYEALAEVASKKKICFCF